MAATTLPRLTARSARKLWIVTVQDGKTEVTKFAVLNSETDFRKIVADLAVGGWGFETEVPEAKVLPQVPIFGFPEAQKALADYLARKAKGAVKAAE